MQEVHGRTYHQPIPELRKNITQGSQLQVETDRMESEQSLDSDQNPIFETQITVENIPAGTGKGYSKKESQQEAAHATLTKIKGDPQFIDAIFAAKAEREKAAETAESENTTAIHEEAIAVEESISVREEEIPEEHFVDTERIIAEAEEVAFREENK